MQEHEKILQELVKWANSSLQRKLVNSGAWNKKLQNKIKRLEEQLALDRKFIESLKSENKELRDLINENSCPFYVEYL